MPSDSGSRAARFWRWFRRFAVRLPAGDPPEELLDELLERLHRVDPRVYFELSTNTSAQELIITAQGDAAAFPIADALVAAAPELSGWAFTSLKSPMGFDFTFRNGEVALKANELWFRPLKSPEDPKVLGLEIGVPNADFVQAHETVDAIWTILETGIGERSCALDVQHVTIADLPADPPASGYLELPRLAEYIAWRRAK